MFYDLLLLTPENVKCYPFSWNFQWFFERKTFGLLDTKFHCKEITNDLISLGFRVISAGSTVELFLPLFLIVGQ